MGVIRKKPYEISIWEDRLVTENNISYYKEVKLAVIGSDKMDSPNRAFDPVLVENVNGEKTLTFSLAFKYYDEYTGKIIENPFYPYLINERKVKLFYNDEWFEFVIKECEETSTENIFNYTAKELFSLELAKLGYNVTLNTELNNNQGTIIELAKRVLENTDWEVDEDNSDLLVQYVQEPLYKAITTKSFSVLDLDKNEEVTINAKEIIYIFYSYINNKTTDYIQFIREKDRKDFFIDDDNVIKATNYRIVSPVNYIINPTTEAIEGIENIAHIEEIFLQNQGYRLVYKIQTTYDPVMGRIVEVYQMPYKGSNQEIYHFLDYNYTTSDIVVSYITNGTDFQLFEDGKIQGWYNTTPVTSTDSNIPLLQPIGTITNPPLDKNGLLQSIDDLSALSGYLELKFNGTLTNNYENTYFNQGFEHSRTIIDHISRGEKFVLRMRYYSSAQQHGELLPEDPTSNLDDGLRVIVAKYETVEQECYVTQAAKDKTQTSKIKAYKIIPDDIILDFDGAFVKSKNIISNGIFAEDDTERRRYLVDNVVQVPSMSYIYKVEGDDTEYIWDAKLQQYIPRENSESFADYYLTTAQAKYSFTNEQMNDPTFKMGIFLYTKNPNLVDKYIYLQDIQLTRYYEDADNQIVTLGNVPNAINQEAHKYYLKPDLQNSENEVVTYGSLKFLANELGANVNTITPVFNESSEKILSIEASNSNYFNILQDLCETFECWLDIRVEHEEDGSIKLDENFNPIKRVAFKEYAGKDNFAGFKNGINLNGITRNIDSNEIVTKLIIEPVQSQYSDTGSIEIQRAKSNPSGQSYILNLSYYMNRGLIEDIEQCNKDINEYNKRTKSLNNQIIELQDLYTKQSNSLLKVASQRTTYTVLIEEAEKQYNEAIERFQQLTKYEYDSFVKKYKKIEGWAESSENQNKNYLENDTVMKTVGEIYASSVTLNNYSGLLTNLNKSYEDLYLECYGAKEHNISVVFIPGDGNIINPSTQVTIDDYISGLKFELIDTEGSSVLYQSSPNKRIFEAFNAVPYKYISFLQLPKGYDLKYYKQDGTEVILTEEQAKVQLLIYDNITEETYNRQFTLIPQEEYATTHIGTQNRIDKLIEEKKEVEKDFYKKYSRFLQEGTWSSQDYIDSELYYFDALQVSDTSAQPKVSYTIDVLEISQIEGFENYDFRVGDKTYIEDTDFFGYLYQTINVNEPIEKDDEASKNEPINSETIYENELPKIITARSPVREEVIVSEIEWHFDEPENNQITVQNYKTRFEDLFQRISATVQAVQRNEITYPKTTSILDKSGLINGNLLANSLDGIGGVGFALTTNGSVAATADGLLVRDLINPANMMRLSSAGIQISSDGGENWGTALNAMGVSTDTLTAGTINTQYVWLMDGDNPSFRWDKSGLNAYGLDEEGNQSYDLKTYVRFDKYGLYGIKNGEDYVASSLKDVRDKAYFGVTWDGFFIKNSYTGGGEVSITSEDDIRILVPQSGDTEESNNLQEKIKIGALEWFYNGETTEQPIPGIAPSLYGIRIKNNAGDTVMKTGDDGNLTITGTINALAGNFTGRVVVGDENQTHILIDGSTDNPIIQSSNFSEGASTGWIIDGNGDATFSNVSVRGAIKTAVFEYEEIQAVGGAFLFRPSSTIKTARYEPTPTEETDEDDNTYVVDYYHYVDGNKVYNDLIVSVEKPLMFKEHNWVKISNYNTMGVDPAADLTTYGLVHIYEIEEIIIPTNTYQEVELEPDANPQVLGLYELIDEEYVLTEDEQVNVQKVYYELVEIASEKDYPAYEFVLRGGAQILDTTDIENIPGGALIDFGNHATKSDGQGGTIDVPGTENYGIGINSSDNYVNLPARAISLFETTIHPNTNPKVTYNMRGILGTLPTMSDSGDTAQVASFYNQNMAGTQGIYTDNMYIGDLQQYLAFYTDSNGRKQLRIRASEIEFETADSTPENPQYHDVSQIEAEGVPGPPGPAGQNGQDAVSIYIEPTNGNVFINNRISTKLICHVYKGGIEITNNPTYLKIYTWTKKDANGNVDREWVPTPVALEPNAINISADDVNSRAIFTCQVDIEEA